MQQALNNSLNLEKELDNAQYRAVITTEGPLLVLAGAGTGKTRVITYRIAHLIKDKGISPANILAVTFTKKAAEEMKQRIKGLIGPLADALYIGTFHSICYKLLRAEYEEVGLIKDFSCLDTTDKNSLIRDVIKEMGGDTKEMIPKVYGNYISIYKNSNDYLDGKPIPNYLFQIGEIYRRYEEAKKQENCVDFDDMLSILVMLFKRNVEILDKYKTLFKYILVDEYQDTNELQFNLIRLLSGADGNLCVVGDDDQSIYGWRGAKIENILNFDKLFLNVKEIKLENNYRSGEGILNAANKSISHNKERRGKTLSSPINRNAVVTSYFLNTDLLEAAYIADNIQKLYEAGEYTPGDMAVLYRTNRQSIKIEKALRKNGIACTVVGEKPFYERAEIKDLLSPLIVTTNPHNFTAFKRSIKLLKGISDLTANKLTEYAVKEKQDIFTAYYLNADKFRKNIQEYLEKYFEFLTEVSLKESLTEKLLLVEEFLNYRAYLKDKESDNIELYNKKIENINQLYDNISDYTEEMKTLGEPTSLSDFLNNTILLSRMEYQNDGMQVKLMTVHAAKGLEFPVVFIAGLEEGLFPLQSKDEDISYNQEEEERRLFYVAVTRAMDKLFLTGASSRSHFNETDIHESSISPFISEAGLRINNISRANMAELNKMMIKKNTYLKIEAEFENGCRVSHANFGIGTVLFSEVETMISSDKRLNNGKNLQKVTVLFDKMGKKSILSNYLIRVKL